MLQPHDPSQGQNYATGWLAQHITSHSSPEHWSLQACLALQVCVVRWCVCPCRDGMCAHAGMRQRGQVNPGCRALPSLPCTAGTGHCCASSLGKVQGCNPMLPVPLALLHRGVGSRYRKAERLLRAGTETLLQRVIWFKKLSGR